MADESDFIMPAVAIGDVVLHWAGSDSNKPTPAIVVDTGDRAVTLKLLPTSRETFVRSGVPHRDDPLLQKRREKRDGPRTQEYHAGFWDHTPGHKELLRLKAQMAARVSVRASKGME